MDEYIRHKNAFSFLSFLIKPFIKHRFNFSFDSLRDIEGPFLLLSNHNTDFDPIFIGLAAGKQLYFVASEHITRGGFAAKLLMRYFKPIIHTKGKAGAQSSIETLRTLKRGHSVCIFPEGNRSFNGLTCPINPSIGKLARRSGVKLVTYRLEGGYFTQPRWGHGVRRGKMCGRLQNVYTPEEMKSMTDAQVYSAICADLAEDAYVTQQREQVAFKGKDAACGLETTLFCCPSCGRFGTLSGSAHRLSCSACGFYADYSPLGLLLCSDGTERSITELDVQQKEKLTAAVAAKDEGALFSDEVTVSLIASDHSVAESYSGALCGFIGGFSFDGRFFSPAEISGAAIHGRNSLVVFAGSEAQHYEITGNESFNALKYLYLYNILHNREE